MQTYSLTSLSRFRTQIWRLVQPVSRVSNAGFQPIYCEESPPEAPITLTWLSNNYALQSLLKACVS